MMHNRIEITYSSREKESENELSNYLNKYFDITDTIQKLVNDNENLSAYLKFIKQKNLETRIPVINQLIKNDILHDYRNDEIKKVAIRYNKRLALEEKRINNAHKSEDVYENSLHFLNDIHRRININLKKINDSFIESAIEFPIESYNYNNKISKYSSVIVEEGKKYDYKIDSIKESHV